MTLYNKRDFVREAIESVLSSSFDDFELLVVDDASTDDSLSIVRSIHDDRIRLLCRTTNSGRGGAANFGFDAARGEYVAVVDADDHITEDRLAKQVEFLDANPNVGVCGSWLKAFGARDTLLKLPETDSDCRSILLFGIPVSYGSCMLRRSLLNEHDIRCDSTWKTPGMDRLFLLRVGNYGRYSNLQQVLTYYRTGEQNMRHGRDSIADNEVLYRAAFDVLGISATPNEIRHHIYLTDQSTNLPDCIAVWKLFAWKNALLSTVHSIDTLHVDGCSAEIERRWERLFHHLVKTNAVASFAHMFLDGMSAQRFKYWSKYTLDRLRSKVHMSQI